MPAVAPAAAEKPPTNPVEATEAAAAPAEVTGLATVWCFISLRLSGFNSRSTLPSLLRMTCRGSAGDPPYQFTRAFHSRCGMSSKSLPRTSLGLALSLPPSEVRVDTR